MHSSAIVPDHQVPDPPPVPVPIDELRLGGVLNQLAQQQPSLRALATRFLEGRGGVPQTVARRYIRLRSSDFMASAFSSRFEMSASASLPKRFFCSALIPVFVWSTPSSRWAKSRCSASLQT